MLRDKPILAARKSLQCFSSQRFGELIDNKAKERISKRVSQEKKTRQFSEKRTFLTPEIRPFSLRPTNSLSKIYQNADIL